MAGPDLEFGLRAGQAAGVIRAEPGQSPCLAAVARHNVAKRPPQLLLRPEQLAGGGGSSRLVLQLALAGEFGPVLRVGQRGGVGGG